MFREDLINRMRDEFNVEQYINWLKHNDKNSFDEFDQIIFDIDKYGLLKEAKKDKKWFKEFYYLDYPFLIKDVKKKQLKEFKSFIKEKKRDLAFEEKMEKQRAKKGYCDTDVWNMDAWFIETVSKMLKKLDKNRMGYPVLDEFLEQNGRKESTILKDYDSDELSARWSSILQKMIFLLDEMDEDKCSMKNPYQKQWWSYHQKFDKKYPKHGDELKTEEEKAEEKKKGCYRMVSPADDPDFGEEYKTINKLYLDYETEIWNYRDNCKNEFFKLFSKYFWNLWD